MNHWFYLSGQLNRNTTTIRVVTHPLLSNFSLAYVMPYPPLKVEIKGGREGVALRNLLPIIDPFVYAETSVIASTDNNNKEQEY